MESRSFTQYYVALRNRVACELSPANGIVIISYFWFTIAGRVMYSTSVTLVLHKTNWCAVYQRGCFDWCFDDKLIAIIWFEHDSLCKGDIAISKKI